jgi:hypothetical protein
VAVTITTPKVWTNVLSAIAFPFNAEIFDEFDLEKVELDVRIISNIVQIRTNKIGTYTVHIDGE